MSNCMRFHNTPIRLQGMNSAQLAIEQQNYERTAPSYSKDWLKTLVQQTLYADPNGNYYLDLANGFETVREWRYYIRVLHRCLTRRNTLHCRTADEYDSFRTHSAMTIVLGGRKPPVFDRQVLELIPPVS